MAIISMFGGLKPYVVQRALGQFEQILILFFSAPYTFNVVLQGC